MQDLTNLLDDPVVELPLRNLIRMLGCADESGEETYPAHD